MKSKLKFLLVWICVIALIFPFCSEVLAISVVTGNEGEKVNIQNIEIRQGGTESSELAYGNDNNNIEYDTGEYAYNVGGQKIWKPVANDSTGQIAWDDMFYCINKEGSLPEYTNHTFEYTNQGDFTYSDNNAVQTWKSRVGISDSDYTKLVGMLNVIYLMKEDTTYKEQFIESAFKDKLEENVNPKNTVESIAATITDDDIDVVQQAAIWYYTNGFNWGDNVSLTYDQVEYVNGEYNYSQETVDLNAYSKNGSARLELMGVLFNYLTENDFSSLVDSQGSGNPEIADTVITSTIEDNYYKVGPYRIDKNDYTGSISSSFKFYDASGNEISNVSYIVKDSAGNTVNSLTYGEDYYVYIPVEENAVTSIELQIKYNNKSITIWTGEDVTTEEELVKSEDKNIPYEDVQDLILMKEDVQTKTKKGTITDYDLALRKVILSINGNSSKRDIEVDTSKLTGGSSTTADYNHSKDPIEVESGDKIIYEFNVYNEGSIDGIAKTIYDYIPEGLSLVDSSKSEINSRFGWNVDGSYSYNGYTRIYTDYLNNTIIPAYNGETLSKASIQVELEVGDMEVGTVLTNIAEIADCDGNDRDSNTSSFTSPSNGYTGNTSNKSDLTDDSYFYKGLEDDDDFEKVVIAGDVPDFALKKFITTVNDKIYDREPIVDTTPLVEGSHDATYAVDKSVVNVNTGDIVTYTIRVYNEGDISGYANEITDYIPEGLGFLVNYNTNYNNLWALQEGASYVNLSEITDGTLNLDKSDFIDDGALEDEPVVLGETKITSNALSYEKSNSSNLIQSFDGGDTLDYRDIEVTCIVTTEDEITLKNIAAITEEYDEEGNEISKDIDSTPIDDIDPSKYTTGNEDDDDYDVIKTTTDNFDLALQKFITGLNDEEITTRIPSVAVDNGEITYINTKDPLYVGNGDLVTYTIRIYNEGNISGYASVITDDIPVGLVYVEDNEINKEFGWEMLDSSGNVTEDVSQAVAIRTSYLSNTLLNAFDGETLSYADVKIVFMVDETSIDQTVTTEERTLVNTAEITEALDEYGNLIDDIDSTPNNWIMGEDDIDQESVYVKYFDLALSKDLTSAIVTVDGQSNTYNVKDGEDSIKVEVNRKKVSSTTIQFVFDVTVTNEGEIAGYATELTDYVPDGLYFEASDNPDWVQVSDKVLTTDALAKTLLEPGDSASVPVILRWEQSEDNTGKFVNIAEISEDWNEYGSPDIDSTPGNSVSTEDDYDTAPVYVSISTGLADGPYIILTTGVLAIIGTGLVLIKKYVM